MQRAYELVNHINVKPAVSDETARKVLFGQDQTVVK